MATRHGRFRLRKYEAQSWLDIPPHGWVRSQERGDLDTKCILEVPLRLEARQVRMSEFDQNGADVLELHLTCLSGWLRKRDQPSGIPRWLASCHTNFAATIEESLKVRGRADSTG